MANKFFGLLKEDVKLFEQGSLPCYGFDGKIILDQKHCVARAPDGNGGIYRAMKQQSILDDMQKRNILYLHAHSVDNILIKVADPVFVGYCVQENAECAAKVLEKSSPSESVGVVAIMHFKYQVVEYSEISQKTAEMRNSDGRLTFSVGNIFNHFFSAGFLRRIGDVYEQELKLHVAKKKIPFIDNAVKGITPEKRNCIKIEKFVFDVIDVCKNAESAGKDCRSSLSRTRLASFSVMSVKFRLLLATQARISHTWCRASLLPVPCTYATVAIPSHYFNYNS